MHNETNRLLLKTIQKVVIHICCNSCKCPGQYSELFNYTNVVAHCTHCPQNSSNFFFDKQLLWRRGPCLLLLIKCVRCSQSVDAHRRSRLWLQSLAKCTFELARADSFTLSLVQYDETPLCVAVRGGHTATAEMLLSRGASAELFDKYGESPLCVASSIGKATIARMLSLQGASMEPLDKGGEAPLCVAAYRGQTDVVEALLDEGSQIDMPDKASEWIAVPGRTRSNLGVPGWACIEFKRLKLH
eukprot:evm.model.scf_560.2 EVM.evm.TU.scf_560.2   scf_560:47263-48769(-)